MVTLNYVFIEKKLKAINITFLRNGFWLYKNGILDLYTNTYVSYKHIVAFAKTTKSDAECKQSIVTVQNIYTGLNKTK